MTAGSASERSAGLASLMSMLDGPPEEERLVAANEPGLLAALNSFLSGSESLTALQVLTKLMHGCHTHGGAVQVNFPRLVLLPLGQGHRGDEQHVGAREGGLDCHRKSPVAGAEDERKREVFDSPDVDPLLPGGPKSAKNHVTEYATVAIHNLCMNKATASAVLGSHPKLVQALVDTFRTSGVCKMFWCKS